MHMRKCWNWQTGMIQVHVLATTCGFKSHFPHYILEEREVVHMLKVDREIYIAEYVISTSVSWK